MFPNVGTDYICHWVAYLRSKWIPLIFFFAFYIFRGSGIPSSYLNSTIRYSLVNGSIETMIKQWNERKKIITSNRTWLTFFFTSDKALYLIDDATKRQRDNHELPKKKKWRREEEEEKNLTKIPQNITRLRWFHSRYASSAHHFFFVFCFIKCKNTNH